MPHVEFIWFSSRVIYCLGSNYQNFLSSLLYFAKDGKRCILNKAVLRHKSSGELAHECRRGDTVPNWQRGAVSSAELSQPAPHKHRRLSVFSLPRRRMSSEVPSSVPATLGQMRSPTPFTERGSIPSKFSQRDAHCY